MKSISLHMLTGSIALMAAISSQAAPGVQTQMNHHEYNGPYAGQYLNRVAFPIGGIGSGMFCLEGTGAISHLSLRGILHFFEEPCSFAAICVRSPDGNIAKVLEGPVQDWKVFGSGGTGNGATGRTYGLPRFDEAEFLARFPFGIINLNDPEIPLDVRITGWSPFLPGNADDSSLPVGALEYRFANTSTEPVDAVFSWNAKNFMTQGNAGNTILPIDKGFVLWQEGTPEHPEYEGGFAAFVGDQDVIVDHCWFKGGWWDSITLAWRNVQQGTPVSNPPLQGSSPGATLSVPFKLQPGEEKTIRLQFAWYAPKTTLRLGYDPAPPAFQTGPSHGTASNQQTVSGYAGEGLVNTFDPSGDGATGTLTSPEFVIAREFIQFLIGGGNHPGRTCIELLVDDRVVKTETGNNAEELTWTTWDVSDLKGRKARIRIVDKHPGAWGHINIDQITLTDRNWYSLEDMMSHQVQWGKNVTILQDFEGDDYGDWQPGDKPAAPARSCCAGSRYHVPWYAGQFENLEAIVSYWKTNYDRLRRESALFRDTFYDTTLPPEVIEAVAANLTILKSPTLLRQTDGRLWCFEGCSDNAGCCHGSCTHVWNYAQAIPHLFPELERSLRQTEFNDSQDARGHQNFRSCLPIRPVDHLFHAAADGQLGGIMKVYREWRLSGDSNWLRSIWPQVRKSLNYCISTWDPRAHGLVEEPHHNTYDIEFWGPDSLCSSFYLGALAAAVEMGQFLGEDVSEYKTLLARGRDLLESKLYNGEYFYQLVETEGLDAKFQPLDMSHNGDGYREIIAALNEQGPKYQYGTGCLSDAVLGFWMARVCGLDQDIADPQKITSSLRAIHRYNLRKDLSDHANPQRPSFALGRDGGLLLCTWPNGGAPALPFVYSDEVWTGIEYQAASHMMMNGLVDEGLEIVRTCRDRYDGRVRNPFDEYECGHWYARALSSYALLQGLTGTRYDALDKTLFIDSRIGDNFRCFLATATGYGIVGLKNGKPFLDVKNGTIDVSKVIVSGKELSMN